MDSIFDYFQNTRPEFFTQSHSRHHFLVRFLSPSQKVLNIGIGDGYLEHISIQKGIDIHSIDPSEQSVQNLKPLMNSKVQLGVSEAIPFEDNTFDCVIMSEVLEHLDLDVFQKTLLEVKRVLKTQGLFLGTVPARENLKESEVFCPHCHHVFHRWGHKQSFDQESLTRSLSPHFQVLRLRSYLFVSWSALNWKGKLLSMLKLFLNRLGIKVQNETLFFKAVKL